MVIAMDNKVAVASLRIEAGEEEEVGAFHKGIVACGAVEAFLFQKFPPCFHHTLDHNKELAHNVDSQVYVFPRKAVSA